MRPNGVRHVGLRVDGLLTSPSLVAYPAAPGGRSGGDVPWAMDARPQHGRWPIVVLSHGSRGSPHTHRRLAHRLASAGHVVVVPEHPGDNATDASLFGSPSNLPRRTRLLRSVLHAVVGDDELAAHVDPTRVALIGHSMGAATALAAAGGCPRSLASEEVSGQPQQLDVATVAETRAVVLLAPATPWFDHPAALVGVAAPVLMLTGELDEVAVPAYHAAVVEQGLRSRDLLTAETVPGAGHFSFLSPFPPERTGPHIPPSQDPPGFDRSAFGEVLAARVAAFLAQHL